MEYVSDDPLLVSEMEESLRARGHSRRVHAGMPGAARGTAAEQFGGDRHPGRCKKLPQCDLRIFVEQSVTTDDSSSRDCRITPATHPPGLCIRLLIPLFKSPAASW